MPLPKRTIEPTHVARSVYQQDEQLIELETVTNTTLTNIIRQLSSISKHAEDVFGELARDVGNIGDRANSLQARIDRLAIKVTQLDSTGEEISLTDIQLKKAFKSIKMFDQQIFSRETMPAPMLETYAQCDKPPPLDKLNVYRDDGKDAIKFYTDPNFFFDLWRQEMLKDTERAMHDKGKKTHRPKDGNMSGSNGGNSSGNNNSANARGHKKRVRQPHNTQEKQRQKAIGDGEIIMPNNVNYRNPQCDESGYSSMSVYDTRPSRPSSIEIKRNYQGEVVDGSGNMYGIVNQQNDHQVYVQANQYHGMDNHNNMSSQQLYEEAIYNPQSIYGGYPISPDPIYGTGAQNRNKIRPSQPPPAPPSNSGTPNASNANTPTRGRSSSSGRDNLPPPPPVPECIMQNHGSAQINSNIMNGNVGGNMAVKFLAKNNSNNSRAGSPQIQDANAMVLAQLTNQINNINLNPAHDLPPPPPVPEQHSAKMSPNAVPPPPPPPPPFEGSSTPIPSMQMAMGKMTTNGDIGNPQANGILISGSAHNNNGKKHLPPFHDTRDDLMKAIRDGIKLRKVEKSDQNDNTKRNVPLNDVASILARRVAIELTDSEDSDSEDDSEVWMEANETSA